MFSTTTSHEMAEKIESLAREFSRKLIEKKREQDGEKRIRGDR
jgi:hypothetical protein